MRIKDFISTPEQERAEINAHQKERRDFYTLLPKWIFLGSCGISLIVALTFMFLLINGFIGEGSALYAFLSITGPMILTIVTLSIIGLFESLAQMKAPVVQLEFTLAKKKFRRGQDTSVRLTFKELPHDVFTADIYDSNWEFYASLQEEQALNVKLKKRENPNSGWFYLDLIDVKLAEEAPHTKAALV